MAEVAMAYVSLVPSAKGFGRAIESQTGGEVTRAGSTLSSRLGAGFKKGALAVGLAVGGILSAAVVSGFKRLSTIEEATAKLQGLGNTAKTTDKIMTNALSAVKGTAFGLDEAATIAASAVAAGIKPGKQLESTLKLVADAATIGGTSLGEMGAIFNKVATSNKVQGDVINQLNDKGIPIVQLLAKQLGVSADKVTDLASRGKIDFATFSAAMQGGVGGAALKSGDTFQGAFKNMQAALGRFGASLLKGVYPVAKTVFGGTTKLLDDLTAKSGPYVEKFSAYLVAAFGKVQAFFASFSTSGSGVEGFQVLLGRLVARVKALAPTLQAGGRSIVDFFRGLSSGGGGSAELGQALASIGQSAKALLPVFAQLGAGVGQGLADTLTLTGAALGFLAGHIDTITKYLPLIIAGFVALKVAEAAGRTAALASIPVRIAQVLATKQLAAAQRQLAVQQAIANGEQLKSNLELAIANARATAQYIANSSRTIAATVRQGVVFAAQKVATIAVAGATRAYAGAQLLLNAVMSANPITLVVIAIVALVAGLIIAYKHSETFRKIVNAAFGAVKVAASAVFGFLSKYVPKVFAAIVAAVRVYVNVYKTVVVTAFNVVRSVVSAVLNAIRATVRAVWLFIAGYVRTQVAIVKAAVHGLTAIVGVVRGAFESARSAAVSKLSALVAFVKGIPGKVVAAFGAANSLLLGVGRNIVDGLVNGIRGAAGRVLDAARHLVDQIPGPIRKLMGIASPSKVMIQIGKFVTAGLIKGLEGGVGKVKTSSAKLADYVTKAFKGGVIGKKGRSNTLDQIADDTKELTRLAAQRSKVGDKLKSAQDKLAAATSARNDYKAQIPAGISMGLDAGQKALDKRVGRLVSVPGLRTPTFAGGPATSTAASTGVTVQGDVYGATPKQIVDELAAKARLQESLHPVFAA